MQSSGGETASSDGREEREESEASADRSRGERALDKTQGAPISARLVVAAAAEERRRAVGQWLEAEVGVDADLLILAPTRGAADDLLDRHLKEIGRPGHGFFNLKRMTPHRLAAEIALATLAEEGKAPVLGLGLEALAARAVDGRRRLDELDYFAPVADSPGFPRALARTLEELRRHDVDAESLRHRETEAAPAESTQAARARDLAKLLESFEKMLEDRQLVDPPGLFDLATTALEGRERPVAQRLLLLDLSLDSPVEARFVAALGRRCPTVLATAIPGDEESIERLAHALGTDAEALPHGPPDTEGPARREEGRLDRLRRDIFADLTPASGSSGEAPPPAADPPDESLIFLSAPGENRECAEIARHIQSAAARGVPFDACAVALRDPETYLPLLEEAFSRAGIDFYASRGARRPDPAGRAFLALLACAEERLSASRFAEYLSLAQLPDADAEGAPPIVEVPWVMPEGDQMVLVSLMAEPAKTSSTEDTHPLGEDAEAREAPVMAGSLRTPRRWERLLVDAAVIEGRDRWRRRLEGLGNERRLQLRHSELGETDRRRLESEIAGLEALSNFALPLIDDLDALPREAPWGRWLESLESLAGRAVKEPRRILETLAELRPMSDIGPVSLGEVRRVLEPRLSTLRGEPKGRRWGQVLVATLDELRGRTYQKVFLPGLAEGRFPRRASEDPLLPDADRRALGAGLPTRPRRVLRERRLLRIAAGAAEEQLVVSYPSLDPLEGRARVPSFYALDLLRAAEGRLPDLRRLERQAAGASSSRLGWPAPRRSSDAIDAAEFDVATLLELTDPIQSQAKNPDPEQAKKETKGSARYLLETNARLRRSLRNRYVRWSSRRFSAADGLVSAEGAASLAEQRLADRSYSPTALQNFAACPYRFYLYAILRLRPRETAERLEQLDPLTRGALFHEVVFELLGRLRASHLLPLQERDWQTLARLADQTLEEVAGRYAEDLAPAIDRIWRSEIDALRLDLRGWIRAVIEEDSTFVPARFELAFGLPKDDGHDPASSEDDVEIAGGRRLRGSIDLVEIDPGAGLVRVTDYKTGRPPRGASHLQVGAGEILQPLLYALAAEELLEERVLTGRLFYSTRRGGYRRLDIALDEDGRDAIDEVLSAADAAIEAGFLPALPRQNACRFCNYRAICGPDEERRVARKRPDERLANLHRVRSLP